MFNSARIAIVTGAGRGIGKAIASAFARKSVFPVLVDIDKHAADAAVGVLKAEGFEAASYAADVSNVSSVRTLVDDVYRQYGSVDILVNNAGVLSKVDLEEIEEAEWDRVMNVNVKSAVFLMKYAVAYMKEKGWGRIVTISSLAGRMGGYSTGCAYSTSKAALLGMSMCVARKVAPFGITVNAVAPGTTDTELAKGFTEKELGNLTKSIPVGKLIRPEGIAEAVCFLASDSAEFITGAVLDVNGGMFMG
jgi:NAD(P)-dependent dehydrogenase (short-subunit alcohol dehydrogenase family)